ncbi:hypothetical protein CHLRE_05g232752v5 [Chlamydomonas reinhardtii]|uniref:Uncharacterized protein n=1 Tax=Chlamydomonas reinhardtii TaxID=3055 RepID=A0A2K3DRW2_CHLRE|nr:uncharacterized protein CHLRE_05g232752v5 [Chlamydomonas reinhardtii]PNW83273.1 hypothetical protein CHLRE_05g232752v5 [Chlamydomonas reinhardtii]
MASGSSVDASPHGWGVDARHGARFPSATASGAGPVALALGICASRRGGMGSLSRSLRSWTALRTAGAPLSSAAGGAVAGSGAAASAATALPAWACGAGAVGATTAAAAAGSHLRRAAGRFGGWRQPLPPTSLQPQHLQTNLQLLAKPAGSALHTAAASHERARLGLGLGWLPARRHMATGGAAAGGGAAAAAAKGAGAAAAAAGGAASALAKRLSGGRLGSALRLQVAAAWQSYGRLVYGGVAVLSVYLVWRLMYGVSNLFIELNNTLAEWGLLGLAVTVVVMGALYGRWRTAVNPAAVYRQAMVKLNTNAGVLEVMGAPLVGSDVRAYVVTGGGLYLSKSMRIKLRSRRIQMMFPLSGPERKGLVSLEAKRKAGRYDWRLLAVDLGPELQAALPAGGAHALSAAPPPRQPAAAGKEGGAEQAAAAAAARQQRVYIVGDAVAYGKGGVLGELRSPFLQALSNSRSYEVEDELEEELDELNVPPEHTGGAAGAAARGLAAAAAGLQSRVRAAAGDAAALLRKAGSPELSAVEGGAAAAAAAEAGAKVEAKAVKEEAKQQQREKEVVAKEEAVAKEEVRGVGEQAAAGKAATEGPSWWSRVRAVVSGPSEGK